MDAFAGPYAVAAMLLVVAGLLEVRRPAATVDALGRIGVGVPVPLVRGAAMLGAGLGVIALCAGGGAAGRVAAGSVACVYLGFSVFVGVTLVRGDPLASCGCFGHTDTPPTLVHLVVNVVGVGAAVAVAVVPADGFPGAVSHQPGAGVALLAMTALCTVFAYRVLSRPRDTRLGRAGTRHGS